MSRIPGLSRSLPAARDVWGREVVGEGEVGPDFLSPLWVSTDRKDPVTQEVLRLGATIGEPSRTVGGVRSTPEQHNAYQALAGRYTHDDIAAAMADPAWRETHDEERVRWIDEIKRDARAAAREELGLGVPADELPAIPPGFQLAQ